MEQSSVGLWSSKHKGQSYFIHQSSSLANIFKGEGPTHPDEFERAKASFQELCWDVDGRREEMKWLVQKLDQLVSHR